MLLQERRKTELVATVDKVVGHEGGGNGGVDAGGGVVGDGCLEGGSAGDLLGAGEDADGAGAHGGSALVAGGAYLGEELRAVAHAVEKDAEAHGVTLPRVALVRLDEPVGEAEGGPGVSRNDGLRDGDDHLGVVGVAA